MDESLRLLHVLRAWYFHGSGMFDPAREDPLFPRSPVDYETKNCIWAAVNKLLNDHPYESPTFVNNSDANSSG